MKRGVFSLMAASLVLAGVWEWHRPRETAPTVVEDQPATVEAANLNFESPEEFHRLCDRLRDRFIAMDQRLLELEHRQIQRDFELDASGNRIAARQSIERVWFADGQEQRELLECRDLLTGRDLKAGSDALPKAERRKLIYPFTAEDEPGTYTYAFDGYAAIDGQTTVRVRFEPAREPLGDKVTGKVWVDPVSFEPVRWEARMASPPVGVDYVHMTVEYAVVETGQVQQRRWKTDGKGGLAFIRKHYQAEIDYADYRPRSGGSRP